MAVPSSGQLRLYADIGTELGVTQSNVSLGSMSDTAGFPAPDSMSDFYGYTDASAPSVTTNAATNVGATSMTLNGNVTSDGGATITIRGFYFGTNPTWYNNPYYTVSGTTGAFSLTRTGLASGTTYYYAAFAQNSVGQTNATTISQATVFAPTLVTPQSDLSYIDTYFSQVGTSMTKYNYYIHPTTSVVTLFGSISKNAPYKNQTNYFNQFPTTSGGGNTLAKGLVNIIDMSFNGTSQITSNQANYFRHGSQHPYFRFNTSYGVTYQFTKNSGATVISNPPIVSGASSFTQAIQSLLFYADGGQNTGSMNNFSIRAQFLTYGY